MYPQNGEGVPFKSPTIQLAIPDANQAWHGPCCMFALPAGRQRSLLGGGVADETAAKSSFGPTQRFASDAPLPGGSRGEQASAPWQPRGPSPASCLETGASYGQEAKPPRRRGAQLGMVPAVAGSAKKEEGGLWAGGDAGR